MSPEYARSFFGFGRAKFAQGLMLLLEMNDLDAERGTTVARFRGGFGARVADWLLTYAPFG
jgi:hypothetical protein